MALELTPKRRREIALAAQIDPIYLYQILEGPKDAKPKLAHRLVEASGGEIQLWHARKSDWFEVWPHLIGSPGAPEPVPAVVPKKTPVAKAAEAVAAGA